MKNYFLLILLALVLLATPAMALIGSGTQGDPYILNNRSDWDDIGLDATAYYRMNQSIDFGGASDPYTPMFPGGSGFIGSIEGGGYTISNVHINEQGTTERKGLFSRGSDATGLRSIRNLYIDEFVINMSDTSVGTPMCAVLIGNVRTPGYYFHNITMNNIDLGCNASGNSFHGIVSGSYSGSVMTSRNTNITANNVTITVEGPGPLTYIGGLTGETQMEPNGGFHQSGITNLTLITPTAFGSDHIMGGLFGVIIAGAEMTEVYVQGDIISTAPTGGTLYAGGIIGRIIDSSNDPMDVNNSYAHINFDIINTGGSEYIGGLLGDVLVGGPTFSTENTYWVGSTTGVGTLTQVGGGGMTGIGTGEITEHYYDKTASDILGFCDDNNCTAKYRTQMNDKNTFSTWDFNTVWAIDNGVSYPYHNFSGELSRPFIGVDIVNVTVTPTIAFVGDELMGQCNVFEENNQTVSVNLTWYENDVLFNITEFIAVSTPGTVESTMTTEFLNHTDTFILECTAFHINSTDIQNSSSVFINLISLPYNFTVYSPTGSHTLNSTGVDFNFTHSLSNDSFDSPDILYSAYIQNFPFSAFKVYTNHSSNVSLETLSTNNISITGNYNVTIEACNSVGCTTASNTTISLCISQWTQTETACIGGVQNVEYTDNSSCAIAYDVPANNGTMESCTVPGAVTGGGLTNEQFALLFFIGIWALFTFGLTQLTDHTTGQALILVIGASVLFFGGTYWLNNFTTTLLPGVLLSIGGVMQAIFAMVLGMKD